jgi:hypothetical protein
MITGADGARATASSRETFTQDSCNRLFPADVDSAVVRLLRAIASKRLRMNTNYF